LIKLISKDLPQFKFQIIEGLTYEAYKQLISKALFVITLGEGLDGYFVETYFSGGVAFAIKNMNFFDEKYIDLPCLFEKDESLSQVILNLIVKYNSPEKYNLLNSKIKFLLSEDYSYKTYKNNIRKFYNEEYTYQ